MNIAICDDDIRTVSQMEQIVDKAFGGNKSEYLCTTFLSGDELLRHVNESIPEFQIYLLDIEMEGTNGLETAARIRQWDTDAIIIFITSHSELMPEAFHVLAFQYILKPVDETKTVAVLLSAINLLERRKSVFQYKASKQNYTLNLSQIEYIESIGRKIMIHTIDGGKREYYGTLKQAAEKAKGLLFARPHNSYIVNMEHMSQVSSHSIQMKNGCSILISSKYHESFHAAYRNFILLRARSSHTQI